jgi:methyl-accepting chemotaxis protein
MFQKLEDFAKRVVLYAHQSSRGLRNQEIELDQMAGHITSLTATVDL